MPEVENFAAGATNPASYESAPALPWFPLSHSSHGHVIDINFISLVTVHSVQASKVEVYAYEEALEAVRVLAEQGKRVWIDPDRVTYAFANLVPRDR